MVIIHKGQTCRVLSFTHRTPGKGNAVVQAKLRNVTSDIQSETRFNSTEDVERVPVTEREMDFLYKDGDDFVFMDSESYEQHNVERARIEDEAPWLEENMKVRMQYVGEQPGGLLLPKTVAIVVTETAPPLKGATASASPKPATLANGVVIKVPQFVESGETIRVDPVEGRYVERAR